VNPREAASKATLETGRKRIALIFLAVTFGAALFAVKQHRQAAKGIVSNSVGTLITNHEVKDRRRIHAFMRGLTCHVTGGSARPDTMIPKGLKRVAVLMADYVYGHRDLSRGFVNRRPSAIG